MRILLVFILILVLYYLVRSLLRPQKKGRTPPAFHSDWKGAGGRELVRDPSCRTYVPKQTALRARIGGQDVFFCSKKCMNLYLAEKGDES